MWNVLGAAGVKLKKSSCIAVVMAMAAFVVTSFATAQEFESYTYIYRGKTVVVPVGERDGIRLNDICLRDIKNCRALRTLNTFPSERNFKAKNSETVSPE